MLILQLVLYWSFFFGTLKNEIPGAGLELWQLKIQQFSRGILKFSTKHKDNSLTLNFSKVPRTVLFILHASSRGLGSKNFRNSSYRENTAGSARVSRLSFRFLWLWYYLLKQHNVRKSKHSHCVRQPIKSTMQRRIWHLVEHLFSRRSSIVAV